MQQNLIGSGRTSSEMKPVRSTQREAWPWWAQFIIVLCVLAFATILVLLPVMVVTKAAAQESTKPADLWVPLVTMFVALTGTTISGIFVFAVFRIDRQVEYTTREIVYDMLRDLMDKTIADQIRATKASLDDQMTTVKTTVANTKTQVGKIATSVQKMEQDIGEIDDGIAKSKANIAQALEEIVPKIDSEFANLKTFIQEMAIIELKKKIEEKDTGDGENGGGHGASGGSNGPGTRTG